MKFIVGNKEFTDYNEAQAYEKTLEEEKANRSKVLAEAIEKNIHIIKYKDNETNSVKYLAVGVDSNGVSSGYSSFPKNIAYAMLEENNGSRYTYKTINGYIKVTERWVIEKITTEELNSVRLDIYHYLISQKRFAGKVVVLGKNHNIEFYDMLYDVKYNDDSNESTDNKTMSFEELIDNMTKGKFSSNYYFL